ncbi:MAG TPA: hypothetical protein VKE88_03385 [Candidatus Nanoarchaeia archaeon]|nr:hypothetical protein [Candidatus Nanoarchaeia archaeon]
MKLLFKREAEHLALEVTLILASVLIFRSAWILLDKVPAFSDTSVLIGMLIVGIVFTIVGFEALFRHKHMLR